MKNSMKLNWILAAAISAALAGPAMAQYRVGSDGRALDANNRVGSNGLNEPIPGGRQQNPNQLGNDIVTGNVTGGRQFRGFVPYSAPGVFEGQTAGALSDRFISQSSSAPYGNVPQNNAQVVQPFYGQSSFVTPPAGFVQQSPSNNSYVPAPAVEQQAGDLRLGETLDIPTSVLPAPGQLVLPGPVDPNTQTNSLITASPLYGTRQWNFNDAGDQAFLNGNMTNGSRQSKIDPTTLQQMQSELLQPPAQNGQLQNAGGDRTTDPNALNNGVGTPLESPQNQPLNNNASALNQNGSINQNSFAALGGPNNLSTGAGVQNRMLMSPQQQSRQYAELSNRLQQYRGLQQLNQLNAQNNLNRTQAGTNNGSPQANTGLTANQPNTPAGMGKRLPSQRVPSAISQPTNPSPAEAVQPTAPAGQPITPQNATGAQASTPEDTSGKPKPLQIHSLSEGVQAKGLKDLLTEAENQMKDQHYNTALEQYELAEQVAPNNPLIQLGRANAELGQSYYTRADTHLRQAFGKDEALLMGQYDLKALLGDERLAFLVTDLKGIAKRETKESRPLFLLAYIAYNTGNERRAAAYLDLAEKRAGGKDPFFALIRKHWALPSDQGQNSTDVLNK